MTKLSAGLEALMPEPIEAFRDKGTFTLEEYLYTADQMREAVPVAESACEECAAAIRARTGGGQT